MEWITLDKQAAVSPEPSGRRMLLEEMRQGNIFAINAHAQQFELSSIDPHPSDGFPGGRLLAKIVYPSGKRSEDVVLDYEAHRGFPMLAVDAADEVKPISQPYELYDRVQLIKPEGNQTLCGVVMDLNRSKFPDCDIIVLWDAPNRGDLITEVHGHEIEPLGERMDERQEVLGHDGQKQSLSEIRQIILDLRAQHEQKYEDRTKQIVQQELAKALASQNNALKQLDDAQKADVARVVSMMVTAHAALFKSIKDACVMHITGGSGDYEYEKVGSLMSNYLDTLYYRATQVTNDPAIAGQAAFEVASMITDLVGRDFFLTRFAFIRKVHDHYEVVSKKGKTLGKFPSKEKARTRLKQIEFFKNRRGSFDPDTIESLDEVTL